MTQPYCEPSFVLQYLFGEQYDKLTREERIAPGLVPASLIDQGKTELCQMIHVEQKLRKEREPGTYNFGLNAKGQFRMPTTYRPEFAETRWEARQARMRKDHEKVDLTVLWDLEPEEDKSA